MDKKLSARRAKQREGENVVGGSGPEWAKIEAATADLNVSDWVIRRWLASGKLEGLKVANLVQVGRKSIDMLARGPPYPVTARKSRPSG